MSWDADLSYPAADGGDAAYAGDWNYTHNTNRMVNEALRDAEWDLEGEPWYRVLDGMTGADGAHLLDDAIRLLAVHPQSFRCMNPPNGWGNYDGILAVLRQMRAASMSHPHAHWRATG